MLDPSGGTTSTGLDSPGFKPSNSVIDFAGAGEPSVNFMPLAKVMASLKERDEFVMVMGV